MSDNPTPSHHRYGRAAEMRTAELERLIQVRIGELERIEHIMQGGHEFNFPTAKNHLFPFEMAELERANRWRTDFNRLQAPTPSMYEASHLMRYAQQEGHTAGGNADAGAADA